MSDRIEEARKRVAEKKSSRIEEAKKRVTEAKINNTPTDTTPQNYIHQIASNLTTSHSKNTEIGQQIASNRSEQEKLTAESNRIQNEAWNNALKKLNYTEEEIRGNTEKIKEVYKQQGLELANVNYNAKDYNYNIIQAKTTGKSETLNSITEKTATMPIDEYIEYLEEEYKKIPEYTKEKNQAYKKGDYTAVGQYEALIENAEFSKEVEELKDKLDDPTFFANFNIGQLQIEYNDAMNKYFQTDSENDFKEAEKIRKKIELYAQGAENVNKGWIISKDFAQYAPQLIGQTKSGLGSAVLGGIAGAGVGSAIPVVGTTAGAVKGAQAGYIAGVGAFSYNQMRGSAYADLLELGVPQDIAKKVAKDSALWQSIVEEAGTAVDLATLGINKLFGKRCQNCCTTYGKTNDT